MLSQEPRQCIHGILFTAYSQAELRNLSVCEIVNTEVLDPLGHPCPGGLHDARMGPSEKDEICQTCNMNFFSCPGHFGHIRLPLPIYNPVFLTQLYKLLRGSCFQCHRLLASPLVTTLLLYQLRALDCGLVSGVQEMEEAVSDSIITNVNDDAMLVIVEAKLKATLEKLMEDMNKEEMRHSSHIKSVVEVRKSLLKKFTKGFLMGGHGRACIHCKTPITQVKLHNNIICIVNAKHKSNTANNVVNNSTSQYSEVTPAVVKHHVQKLWENEMGFLQHFYRVFCGSNFEKSGVDMFFMDYVIVPPPRFRRLSLVRGRMFPSPQTHTFNEILKDCVVLKNILLSTTHTKSGTPIKEELPRKATNKDMLKAWLKLQRHVNELFDSDTDSNEKKSPGIKQLIEKKEGLFRKNLMGKRVNYAARSVISPDPYIMVNEVGIPLVFAKRLTFPEPLTQWNVESLRVAVQNGPFIYPGAECLEKEDGQIIKLRNFDQRACRAFANTLMIPSTTCARKNDIVKVHRHLRNGDMVLLNRQPTLHKPSIMSHKVRVLPGEKTVHLHYACCKSYNADFDGDEMNVHLPQDLVSQSECRNIVNVTQQYLVPKDGTPLSGLIQDHIIAGVLLSIRGRFFPKEDYQKLLHSAVSRGTKPIKLLPPSILKPQPLWSGKQIISSVILNIIPEGKEPPTVEGKAKVPVKAWQNDKPRKWLAGGEPLQGVDMSESEVIIQKGELMCGVIDKAHVGATPYSFVHVCYELYGGATSTALLSAFCQLFTHYLQYYLGFSLGIEDIVLNEKASKKRTKVMRIAKSKGHRACMKAFDVGAREGEDIDDNLTNSYMEAHFDRDDTGLKNLDFEMKKVTDTLNNDINNVCIPNGLRKKFPSNNLQLIVQSGAKGSSVNTMQISCLLGQIELEGRRMPLMLNGASLPSFMPYDCSPRSGGFVDGRFLSGVKPPEYFFHCMAGREGLIDTAVKTSRSGYLQRCLIKHLEGVSVNYDMTVRDSDGSVIQFLYGEDGLDVLKMQMLKTQCLNLLAKNHSSAINKKEIKILKKGSNLADIEMQIDKVTGWKKQYSGRMKRMSVFNNFDYKFLHAHDPAVITSLQRQWFELEKSDKLQLRVPKTPDPVNGMFRPDLNLGSVSESLQAIISEYMEKHGSCLDMRSVPRKKFRELCYYRAMRALAEPGEPVGLLAAQSIGEPSTQMTLNTFHFAGKGEMNVTLGIPRLREILMVASRDIAIPTMDLPLLDEPGILEKAEKLKLMLSPIPLKEVLQNIRIKEVTNSSDKMKCRSYSIKMKFLSHREYKGLLYTTPSKILKYIEHTFISQVVTAMSKKFKLASASKLVGWTRMKDQSVGVSASSGDEESDVDVQNIKKDIYDESETDGESDTTSLRSKTLSHDYDYSDTEEESTLLDDSGFPETEEDDNAEAVNGQELEDDIEERLGSLFEYVNPLAANNIEKSDRINYVRNIHRFIWDYDYDHRKESWCEFTLRLCLEGSKLDLETLLVEQIMKANVYKVPEIEEVMLVKNPHEVGTKMMLKTKGVNFAEILKYTHIIDIDKVYSNNIHAVADTYGIEAATQVIMKEVKNVFKTYGIEVDPHHLSLVADYMTSSGVYRPFNRLGMDGSASPLQQMSFETTKNFMVDSLLMGLEDNLKSPSANIIAGQLIKSGTGAFSMLIKFDIPSKKKKKTQSDDDLEYST